MWIWMALLVSAILMIGFYSRFKKPALATAFGVGSGLAAFFAVGYFTDGLLSLTLFQILTAAIAGIPGVFTVVLINLFFV